MELTNQEVSNSNSISFSSVLICVGTIILLIALKDKEKESGTNQLTEIPIIVHEKPFYVGGSKDQNRIVIRSNNYSSHFWITDGSLAVVSKRPSIQDLIYKSSAYDTLWVGISERDKMYLYLPNTEIKTYSLRSQESIMFTSSDVSNYIEGRFYNYLLLGVGAVALGL